MIHRVLIDFVLLSIGFYLGVLHGYRTYQDDMLRVSNRLKIGLRKRLEELNNGKNS